MPCNVVRFCFTANAMILEEHGATTKRFAPSESQGISCVLRNRDPPFLPSIVLPKAPQKRGILAHERNLEDFHLSGPRSIALGRKQRTWHLHDRLEFALFRCTRTHRRRTRPHRRVHGFRLPLKSTLEFFLPRVQRGALASSPGGRSVPKRGAFGYPEGGSDTTDGVGIDGRGQRARAALHGDGRMRARRAAQFRGVRIGVRRGKGLRAHQTHRKRRLRSGLVRHEPTVQRKRERRIQWARRRSQTFAAFGSDRRKERSKADSVT